MTPKRPDPAVRFSIDDYYAQALSRESYQRMVQAGIALARKKLGTDYVTITSTILNPKTQCTDYIVRPRG
jgi:hypothetical protein